MGENFRRALASRGYVVDVTRDGSEALGMLRCRPYHLIVTDLIMPRMGGLSLLERLRDERCTAPIIIVTAFSGWAMMQNLPKLGVVRLLEKPIAIRQFLQEVDRVLGPRTGPKPVP